jgi:ribonuclease BN (tRNA processing enzyme)
MRTSQPVSTAPSAFSAHVTHAEYLRLAQMARAEALHARHAAMEAHWAKVGQALRSFFSLASVRVAKDLGTAQTTHVKA